VQILSGLAVALHRGLRQRRDERTSPPGTSLKSLDDAGHAAAGVLVFIGARRPRLRRPVHHAGRQVSAGAAQGIRITTVVYGALGSVVGLIGLFVGLDTGTATAVILPLPLGRLRRPSSRRPRWFPAARRGSHAQRY